MVKKILKIIAIVIVAVVVAGGAYVAYEVHAFDTSMAKEYQAPLPSVARTTEATALARGKHLAESVGGCASKDCHGSDLGGGNTMEMGPLGTIAGPNLTRQLAKYSDGELARPAHPSLSKPHAIGYGRRCFRSTGPRGEYGHEVPGQSA